MDAVVIITVAVSIASFIHGIIMRTFNVKLKSLQSQINRVKEEVHNDILEIKETVYRIESDLKQEVSKLENIIYTKLESKLNNMNNNIASLRERVAKLEAKHNQAKHN